ncbi:MAG: hypothetical protein H6719_38810, partial [Sandaracinaceae bacterium]|nr:hypothetical protein [Sandaracinaceae bacterium]
PVTTLARARRAIEEERRWAATRPYEVEHYPEVMIGPGGDHLVLRLRFAEREPPQLGDMVRGAGGKPIGDGMVAFEVGMRAGTHTNPDGSEVQTEYVEPLRARKAIRALDETLLTPLVKAHGLRSVRPYLALGSGLEPELIELLARGG